MTGGIQNIGRIPAIEILLNTPIVQKYILEAREGELLEVIKKSHEEGMIDFTENLKILVDRGDIDKATALEWAPDPEKLKMAFKGINVAASGIL